MQLFSVDTSVTSDIQSIFQQLIIVLPPPSYLSSLFHSIALTPSFFLFLFFSFLSVSPFAALSDAGG